MVAAGFFPKIPNQRPQTPKERNAIVKAVAAWLAEHGGTAAEVVASSSWLYYAFPYINAYLDPPKSLGELNELASMPQTGYDIHHIVEQTPAAQVGFPRKLIDRDDNLTRIPTLKHWQINAWYQTKSRDFDNMSPREYLRYKRLG
jgi:hypothetical protein